MLVYRRIRSSRRGGGGGGGEVSHGAWEKIERAVVAKTMLVTVGDHARIGALKLKLKFRNKA